MTVSRYDRIEDRRAKKRLYYAIAGIIGVLLFLLLFGVRILIGFSVFVDWIRGAPPQQQQQSALLLPPILDPAPEATFSAHIKITGSAQADTTLIVYLNEKEFKKMTVPAEGTFELEDVALQKGENVMSAKITDGKENMSQLSNVLHIIQKSEGPLMEVTSPDDRKEVVGDDSRLTIEGKTEEESSVTVNGRFVVVNSDGAFHYTINLSEGETILKIVATDVAGNQSQIERRVTYRR